MYSIPDLDGENCQTIYHVTIHLTDSDKLWGSDRFAGISMRVNVPASGMEVDSVTDLMIYRGPEPCSTALFPRL